MTDAIVRLIRADMTNCYLISLPHGSILVDTGTYGFWRRKFIKEAAANETYPSARSILAIFITHGHFDHIGSAAGISKDTGAPILIHNADYSLLKSQGRVPAEPQGSWARVIMAFSPLMMAPHVNAGFIAEGVFGDAGTDLKSMGFDARIIHAPGHTLGSSALVLEDGRAFIGDMAMSGFPSLSSKTSLPVICQDVEQNIQSWRMLLEETGAKLFYPGHGRPFTRDQAKQFLDLKST